MLHFKDVVYISNLLLNASFTLIQYSDGKLSMVKRPEEQIQGQAWCVLDFQSLSQADCPLNALLCHIFFFKSSSIKYL